MASLSSTADLFVFMIDLANTPFAAGVEERDASGDELPLENDVGPLPNPLFGQDCISTASCFVRRAPCCCSPGPRRSLIGGHCLFWGGFPICRRSGRIVWRVGCSAAGAPGG